MSSPTEAPTWNTTSLWGILAVFLVIGTVGAGTAVYGLVGVVAGDLLDLVWVAVGAVVAALAFLFMAGILYRVDRYRGANLRRIDLFE
jgi:amino acid transporter